jgi:biotin transport system substrate-specific component
MVAARDWAYVAVFCGVVAALGAAPALYPLGGGVPITLQSMGPMLAGSVIGARRGGLALVLFVVLVAAGLPLLAGGVGGLALFTSPRAGFLVGFPVGAYVVGRLVSYAGERYRLAWGITANVVGGIVVIYLFGVAGISLFGNLGLVDAARSVWIFVPGDAIKAVVAAVIAQRVHRSLPGLLADSRQARNRADV